MANLKGYTPLGNPEYIALDFEDGSTSHAIHDPTGEYRKEVEAIVPKIAPRAEAQTAYDNASRRLAEGPGAAQRVPITAMTPPDPMAGALAMNDPANPKLNVLADIPDAAMAGLGWAAAPVAAARTEQATANIAAANAPPAPSRIDAAVAAADSHAPPAFGSAKPAAPEAGAPPARGESAPYVDPYPARYTTLDSGGGGVSSSTTTGSSSTGLNAKDKAAVDAANAKAVESQKRANDADYVARAEQFYSDWQRLGEDAKAKLAERSALEAQEREFTGRVEAQRARNAQTAARAIDPAQAFDGEAGGYAFMAALGDSIANFGAALAGRGPVADPVRRLQSMMQQSIDLQMAQKQGDLEQGRLTADQFEAEREGVRFKVATAAKQLVELEEKRAHTADEYKALGVLKERFQQEQDAASAKNALATARQETRTQQTTTTRTPQTTSSSTDYFLGEDQQRNGGWKAVEAHTERQAGGDQVDNAVNRFQKATGYTWDAQALGGFGAFRDKNGNVVTADKADVPGVTGVGTNFKFASGEMGREVQGALGDLAAGRAKIADPVGAVSDRSIDAQREQMAGNTDEGAFRAMENAARQLKVMREKVDAAYSPGVVNASRLRRKEEKSFQGTRQGLPQTREATPESLRAVGR